MQKVTIEEYPKGFKYYARHAVPEYSRIIFFP
jgi:hypothetical protein